jgi:hypothetical protein
VQVADVGSVLTHQRFVRPLDPVVDDVSDAGLDQLVELIEGAIEVVVQVAAGEQVRGHEVGVGDLEPRQRGEAAHRPCRRSRSASACFWPS